MGSPAVHEAESLQDALNMLDNHVPLTHREKKLIITSLYDLAFREGAAQGRQAGIEHAQNVLREEADSDLWIGAGDAKRALHQVAAKLSPAGTEATGEYRDTTTVIREKLAAEAVRRDAGRTKIDGRHVN